MNKQNLPPTIICCSPRKGGNCDTTATLISNELEGKLKDIKKGLDVRTVFLRDYSIAPCIACGFCKKKVVSGIGISDIFKDPTLGCPLSKKDDAKEILSLILNTDILYVVAPIYFYHIPANFKALIDRMQPFWDVYMSSPNVFKLLPHKKFSLTLIAGQKEGQRLFEGSIMSIKFAFRMMNKVLEQPLLLRGLDDINDLKNSIKHQNQIADYIANLNLND